MSDAWWFFLVGSALGIAYGYGFGYERGQQGPRPPRAHGPPRARVISLTEVRAERAARAARKAGRR